MNIYGVLRRQVSEAVAFFTSPDCSPTSINILSAFRRRKAAPSAPSFLTDTTSCNRNYKVPQMVHTRTSLSGARRPCEGEANRVGEYNLQRKEMEDTETSPLSVVTNTTSKSSETSAKTIDEAQWEFLGCGKSGAVYGIDSTRVLKVYHDEEAGTIERQVYQRLASHPNIATLLEIQADGSIILERGVPIRTICRTSSFKDIPIQTKLQWLQHAAEGYRHVHACGIIHGDVGCGNQILRDGYVKLIDFEGCSIDGGTAGSCYEWFSYRPSSPRVSQGTDIFAFGCAMYEVSTGRPPFHELETSDNKYREVEELYTRKCFPDIMGLPLGQLIHRCWNGDLSSMEEIIRELDLFALGIKPEIFF